MTTNPQDELQEAALNHLWMPTQDWADLAENGVTFMDEGDGVRIRTSDGKWGYDGIAGLMLVNVGHGRQEIVDAIAGQLGKLHYANTFKYGSEPVARFAARGRVAHPGRPQSRLLHQRRLGGRRDRSEGRLPLPLQPGRARQAQVHRARGLLPRHHARSAQRPPPPATSTVPPTTRSCRTTSAPPRSLRTTAARTSPSRPPSSASAARRPSRTSSWKRDRRPSPPSSRSPSPSPRASPSPHPSTGRCSATSATATAFLLIADEVITGWGRTGRWFGIEHWNVVPDMMTMAKGITSGYFPVGACVVRDAVFEEFQGGPETTYRHGITYGGHPAGGAAGLANVGIMEREDLVGNSERMGERLLTRLEGMREHPAVGDVRGLGLMCAVDLVSDKQVKTPLAETPGAVESLNQRLVDGGLYTRTTRQVFFAPPLCVHRRGDRRHGGTSSSAHSPPRNRNWASREPLAPLCA